MLVVLVVDNARRMVGFLAASDQDCVLEAVDVATAAAGIAVLR